MRRHSRLLVAGTLAFCWLVRAGAGATQPVKLPARVELRDQFEQVQKLEFPAPRITVLTLADRKGSEEIDPWIAALKARYKGRVDFRGVANVSGVPGFLQGAVRKKFREVRPYPIMMDWTGELCARLGYQPGVATILVVAKDGVIRARFGGRATATAIAVACDAVDHAFASDARETNHDTTRP